MAESELLVAIVKGDSEVAKNLATKKPMKRSFFIRACDEIGGDHVRVLKRERTEGHRVHRARAVRKVRLWKSRRAEKQNG